MKTVHNGNENSKFSLYLMKNDVMKMYGAVEEELRRS
jgi:hypothetical protein